MWVGIVPCRVPQRILSSVWQVGLALVPMGSCVVPLKFVDGCWLWCCLVDAALGFPWCVVGWPRKSGRIVGTPLSLVPPCCCPHNALFDRLLDQALFGGGGGGAPGRGIGVAIDTGTS